MQRYFDYYHDGPAFALFGTGHLAALAIIAAVLMFLIWGWRDPSDLAKRRARWLIIGLFLILELSWHGWNLGNGGWSMQRHLPLHTCSISAWLSIYVLLTRSYRVYEIIFFIGIAGASQSLLTPDAGPYGLPHFRAIQTLATHGLIIIAMVYMTTIEKFRPTWSSVWRTMLIANIYLVLVTAVNVSLDSNYMYTLRKPSTASLLDAMGPWPWYLVVAEFAALAIFTLLYLPFAASDWREQKAACTGVEHSIDT
jgi:hypothetical integral membrane protein (TIGR02206 family)